MTGTRPRSTHILLASALAFTAFAAAPALSDPAAAPAQAKDLPDPLHPCTTLLCLPPRGTAAPAAATTGQATACATAPAPDKVASDPDDGGQATAAQRGTGWNLNRNVKAGAAATSDPEEGGQVTARKGHVGDISVPRRTDTASTKLMDSAAPPATCPPVQH